MTVREVIENELKCVQRDCCRLENECAKCDLVLPKEEIINAYNKALKLEKENEELKKQVEQKRHLADVRLEQSLENYKLFSDERKARIDVDIALEDMTDNLTKAKEHIRTLISCLINWVQEGDKDYCYITDAEQFLKECE